MSVQFAEEVSQLKTKRTLFARVVKVKNKKWNGVTQVCSGCGVELHMTSFHIDKTRASGRRSACKECHRARQEARDYIAAKAVARPKPKKRDFEFLEKFWRDSL